MKMYNGIDKAYVEQCKIYTLNIYLESPNYNSLINKDSKTATDESLDYIRSIPNRIKKFLLLEIQKYDIEELEINILGMDVYLNNENTMMYFTEFKLLMSELYRLYRFIEKRSNIKYIKYRWYTNGLFNSKINGFLYNFIEEYPVELSMNFNPYIFKDKYLLYKWISVYMSFIDITDISLYIELTKNNINEIIYGNQSILNTFYDIVKSNKTFSPSIVNAIYYMPNRSNWRNDIPNEEDIFQFFKWCIDNNLYKVNVISYLYNSLDGKVNRYCDCERNAMFINGKTTKNCTCLSSFADKHFYGKYTNKINDDTCCKYSTSLGEIKNGCNNCEYKSICQKLCWMSVLFDYNTVSNCPIRRLYKYIEWRNYKSM